MQVYRSDSQDSPPFVILLFFPLCAACYAEEKPSVLSCFLMIGPDVDMLCWNVRGLNQQARKDVVHNTIATTLCHLACFQEPKLQNIDAHTAMYLGGYRLSQFAFKPATGVLGTRGGLLLLWNDDHAQVTDITIGEFHLSATIIL